MSNKFLAFLVVGGLLYWYQHSQPDSVVIRPIETVRFQSESNSEVVLYATQWCGYCRKTRQFLADNDIAYFEYDIENSSQGAREYKQLNGRGIPLVLVNNEVIRGYNPKAILAAVQALD